MDKIEWLEKAAKVIMSNEIECCSMVVQKSDGETLTAYFQCSASDMMMHAGQIQTDAMIEVIAVNEPLIKQKWEENDVESGEN